MNEGITVDGLRLTESFYEGLTKMESGGFEYGFTVHHIFHDEEKDRDIGCSAFYKTDEELRKALPMIRVSHARAIKERMEAEK